MADFRSLACGFLLSQVSAACCSSASALLLLLGLEGERAYGSSFVKLRRRPKRVFNSFR